MRKLRFALIPLALVTTLALLATPASAGPARRAVGTDAERAGIEALLDAPGGVAVPGGVAIPLESPRPSWFTPAVEAELDRKGGTMEAPVSAPLPSEVGIRPGAWMISPAGCTMNFVFQSRSSYAIGTAGHCVDNVGQEVTLLTLAPGTENPVLVKVGKVLARHDNGPSDDFALVSVRPELNSWVDPTIALIGGPCGAYHGSGPETVWHYGHGLAIGTGGTPRAGVALTWKPETYGFDSPAIYGDSGSPVRVTALQAAGNLTHLVLLYAVIKGPGYYLREWAPSAIAGTRIGKMLKIAKGYSLANSPLCA